MVGKMTVTLATAHGSEDHEWTLRKKDGTHEVVFLNDKGFRIEGTIYVWSSWVPFFGRKDTLEVKFRATCKHCKAKSRRFEFGGSGDPPNANDVITCGCGAQWAFAVGFGMSTLTKVFGSLAIAAVAGATLGAGAAVVAGKAVAAGMAANAATSVIATGLALVDSRDDPELRVVARTPVIPIGG